jgi:hypothetical protein
VRLIGALTLVALLGLSACGSSDSGVSPSAGKILDLQVAALRVTAARADRDAAAQQLALLRASVDKLRADGDLSASAAARIRKAADEVDSQLVLLPTTTTTTTTTPPDDRQGNGKDHGKGKDHGGD